MTWCCLVSCCASVHSRRFFLRGWRLLCCLRPSLSLSLSLSLRASTRLTHLSDCAFWIGCREVAYPLTPTAHGTYPCRETFRRIVVRLGCVATQLSNYLQCTVPEGCKGRTQDVPPNYAPCYLAAFGARGNLNALDGVNRLLEAGCCGQNNTNRFFFCAENISGFSYCEYGRIPPVDHDWWRFISSVRYAWRVWSTNPRVLWANSIARWRRRNLITPVVFVFYLSTMMILWGSSQSSSTHGRSGRSVGVAALCDYTLHDRPTLFFPHHWPSVKWYTWWLLFIGKDVPGIFEGHMTSLSFLGEGHAVAAFTTWLEQNEKRGCWSHSHSHYHGCLILITKNIDSFI